MRAKDGISDLKELPTLLRGNDMNQDNSTPETIPATPDNSGTPVDPQPETPTESPVEAPIVTPEQPAA